MEIVKSSPQPIKSMTGSKPLFVIAMTFAVLIGSVALHPKWRQSARTLFKVPYRKVLSTATGDLLNDGRQIQVVKIRTQEGIFIEVYRETDEGTRPMIDQFKLPDQKDGYFHFRGQATNLALEDIDGDEVLEILAPSFDDELMARLNVYAYNQEIQRFQPIRR